MRAALVVLLACLSTANAQTFPTKPIRLLVPSGAGGAPDILGRLVAQKLTEGLGQQTLVENRPGAGGTIGAEAVAKAPPDGYTIGLTTTSAIAVAPALYPSLGYDPVKSFEAVVLLTTGHFLIVVHPSVPANTLKELIGYAKSRPGALNYASPGNGTPHHIAGEMFKAMAGVNMVHVPYKAAAHLGVMANEAQIMFEGLGPLIGPVRGGKLKAIAAAGPKRFGQLPNVPTTAEAGLPGFEITVHMGLVAPKDTPGEVVRGLNAVVMKAMSTREVTDMFISQGLEPTPASPERYAAIIRDDVLRWARASKSVGAKVD